MMPAGVWGARMVWAWVRLYTAAMPTPVALARREELLSDIHDQIADEQAAGRPGRSYALCRRLFKGIVADVVWRAQVEADLAGRDVLLARPGAVLSGLVIMSLPLSLMAEVTRHSTGWLRAVYDPAWFLSSALWMLAISYGMVAAGEAVVRRRTRR